VRTDCGRHSRVGHPSGIAGITGEQKERFERLRSDGLGYKRILTKLGLSLNTVQCYCRRHPTEIKAPTLPSENGERLLTILSSFVQEESLSASENQKRGYPEELPQKKTRNYDLNLRLPLPQGNLHHRSRGGPSSADGF